VLRSVSNENGELNARTVSLEEGFIPWNLAPAAGQCGNKGEVHDVGTKEREGSHNMKL